MKTKTLLIFVLLLSWFAGSAQERSNRGKEFWLGYGYHWIFTNPDGAVAMNSQEMALYISAEQATTVTVSITNTSWTRTLNIPANTVDATILIPKTAPDDARILSDGLSNRAVHIVSTEPVAVYAHVYVTQGSGASMLMPVETYGYSYYSVNYRQYTSNSQLPNINTSTQNGPDWYSWFYVIAPEDNTRIEITPSDTTKNGWLPGQTYTVNLNKGEIYNVWGKMFSGSNALWAASKDMTGSKIVSVIGSDGVCHPITVFSGSSGIRICRGDGGEYMQQQIFPVQAWGTRYLTYHTINNTNTDILETNRNYYRVCVSDPTAVVKRNGVPMAGLVNNLYYEYQDSLGGDYIESDKPVMIAQYMVNENQCWNFPVTTPAPVSNGDPEMFYISPIEQGQKSVRFWASRQSPAVSYVYSNITIPTTGVASLRVDGNPVPASQIIAHPNLPSYSVALVRFIGPAAQHTITSDSAFNAIVYGLGNYESYGYNVGTLINNLNYYSAIKNSLSTSPNIDTFTCPKTPVRLFVKVSFPAGSLHWKLSQVAGITPNVDSVILNPTPVATEIINGRMYYTYSLQQDFTFAQPGTYYIPVTYSTPVIPNCNQTENATVTVVVKPGPVANFDYTPACVGKPMQFTGTSVAGPFTFNNYVWNFDDNTTQNTINAIKTFATGGNQNVRYRVFADNGCVGDTTKVVPVTPNSTVTFTVNGRPCLDSLFSFTSSVPATAANTPNWYWSFGDGQIANINNSNIATHTYTATATNIIVRHAVSYASGCPSDTAQVIIPAVFNNPVASFNTSADTICEKSSVSITSTTANISNWNWNFGNGTGNNTPTFTHTYNTAGPYSVSLTATDNNGCGAAPVSKPVYVKPNPVVNAGPDMTIPLTTSAQLNATVTPPGNYSYTWTPSYFLNATNILNPVSTPDSAITYTLTVTDINILCTASDKITVVPISKLFIPSAFTPNGDGKNDTWQIPGLALYPDAVITVFNRWGEKVYETKDYFNHPWNGLYKGARQTTATFVYVLRLNDDKKQVFKGTVTIIE